MGRNIQNDSILSALEVETKEGTYDSLMGKIKKNPVCQPEILIPF